MQDSSAAVAGAELHSSPTPRLVRRGRVVHIDPLGSERALLDEPDGLAAARGILFGTAAGLTFWLVFGLSLRAVWGWLAG